MTASQAVQVLDAWVWMLCNPGASYRIRSRLLGVRRGEAKASFLLTLDPDDHIDWPNRFEAESPDLVRIAAAESLVAREPDLARGIL